MNFVTVTEVLNGVDQNEKPYVMLRVAQDGSKVHVCPQTGKRTIVKTKAKTTLFGPLYEENYLPTPQRDDFVDAEVGDAIEGKIVTRAVETPYQIPDGNGGFRDVTSYTTFVQADTEDTAAFEVAVTRAFEAQGHVIKGATVMAPANQAQEETTTAAAPAAEATE